MCFSLNETPALVAEHLAEGSYGLRSQLGERTSLYEWAKAREIGTPVVSVQCPHGRASHSHEWGLGESGEHHQKPCPKSPLYYIPRNYTFLNPIPRIILS